MSDQKVQCEDCGRMLEPLYCVATVDKNQKRHISCLKCSPEHLEGVVEAYLTAVPDPRDLRARQVVDAMKRYAVGDNCHIVRPFGFCSQIMEPKEEMEKGQHANE